MPYIKSCFYVALSSAEGCGETENIVLIQGKALLNTCLLEQV